MFTFIIIATIIISIGLVAYSKWVDNVMERSLENRDALAKHFIEEDARLKARKHLRGE